MSTYDPAKTAIVLIGYQNDWYGKDGVFNSVFEDTASLGNALANTDAVLNAVAETPMTIISAPIVFSESYNELENPVGFFKKIQEAEAFKAGTVGAAAIENISKWGDRIVEVSGCNGFDAFNNSNLAQVLNEKGIEKVVVCGAISSLSVNATAMTASQNYDVAVLSDCVSSRTQVEQELFCNELFPYFAEVLDHKAFIGSVSVPV